MHSGTINIEGGELVVDNGQLQSGTVNIDMNSLTVSDLNDAGEKKELESHLKDGDFFNVRKYPQAQFKFSEVLPSTLPAFNAVIAGELTMKGKSKTVNVPVKLILTEDLLTAESAAFPINRTDWGVNFRSGILGTVRDKMIEDVVPLSLKLKAKPKGKN
jgi:polyisoprenoid-binding protein YceI